MTLKSVCIAGYKAYPNSVNLPVRPITLLYGENSTGKSSLMRILPIISETVRNPSLAPLTLSPVLTKSANLADLFSKYRDDGIIELTMWFSLDADREISLSYQFKNLERDRVVLIDFTLRENEEVCNAELDISTLDALSGEPHRYIGAGFGSEVVGLSFNGLLPTAMTGANEATERIVGVVAPLLASIHCYWLAPLRQGVPRISRVTNNYNTVGSFGEGCTDILYDDFQANGPIFRDVSAWFEQNCAATLQVVPGAHEFGALASLALVHQGKSAVRIPLEDCGEGIAQVLPVLVLAALAAHGRLGSDPIVILEHPDLHLHSNVHYDLMNFIAEASKSTYAPRFIIESHAESILMATQLHIAKKILTSENVAAMHIKDSRVAGASATLVQFDAKGAVAGDADAIDWFEKTNVRALSLAKTMIGLP